MIEGLGVRSSVLLLYAYEVLVKKFVVGPQGGEDAAKVVEHRVTDETSAGDSRDGQPQRSIIMLSAIIAPAVARAATVVFIISGNIVY